MKKHKIAFRSTTIRDDILIKWELQEEEWHECDQYPFGFNDDLLNILDWHINHNINENLGNENCNF